MQKWEHMAVVTEQRLLENHLSMASAEGWELVTAYVIGPDDSMQLQITLIFKRPIE